MDLPALALDRLTVGQIDQFPIGSFVIPLERDDGPYLIAADAKGDLQLIKRVGRDYYYDQPHENLGAGLGTTDFELRVDHKSARAVKEQDGRFLRRGSLVAQGNAAHIVCTVSNGVVSSDRLVIKANAVTNLGDAVAFGSWKAVLKDGDKDYVIWEHPGPEQ